MVERPFSEPGPLGILHMVGQGQDGRRVTYCGKEITGDWEIRFVPPSSITCPDCKAKVDRGHVLENDPPAGMTAMRRETCTVCGSARIIRPDGSFYGSARDRDCPE